jgi:DNA-binding CsgD family transcriptional regulator
MSDQSGGDLAVVASIHAAGVDAQRWPEALEGVARLLDASSAALIFQDRASTLLELKYSTDADDAWLVDYLRNHRQLDWLRSRALSEPGAGRVFSSADFVSRERFLASAFFQRWMAPHKLGDIVGAVIHRSPEGTCIFVALRKEAAGPVDDATRQRLSELLPHLERAARLRPPEPDLARRLVDLFDCLSAPMLILNRDLQISYLNWAAERMLETHPALSRSNGALAVADARARETLARALDGDASENRAIMLRSGEERCCIVHVLPFAEGGGALFVRSLSLGAEGGAASTLYGLTARERSVLLSIAEVGGVPATAQSLGLSEGTVKSYLKSIFQKTGATRQADLVKLVMALESPFAADPRPRQADAPGAGRLFL